MILKKFSAITVMAVLLGNVLFSSSSVAMMSNEEFRSLFKQRYGAQKQNKAKDLSHIPPKAEPKKLNFDDDMSSENLDSLTFEQMMSANSTLSDLYKKVNEKRKKQDIKEQAKKIRTDCQNNMVKLASIVSKKIKDFVLNNDNALDVIVKDIAEKLPALLPQNSNITKDELKNSTIKMFEIMDNNDNFSYCKQLINDIFTEENSFKIYKAYKKNLNDYRDVIKYYKIFFDSNQQCNEIIDNNNKTIKYEDIEYVKNLENSKKFLEDLNTMNTNDFVGNNSETKKKLASCAASHILNLNSKNIFKLVLEAMETMQQQEE